LGTSHARAIVRSLALSPSCLASAIGCAIHSSDHWLSCRGFLLLLLLLVLTLFLPMLSAVNNIKADSGANAAL